MFFGVLTPHQLLVALHKCVMLKHGESIMCKIQLWHGFEKHTVPITTVIIWSGFYQNEDKLIWIVQSERCFCSLCLSVTFLIRFIVSFLLSKRKNRWNEIDVCFACCFAINAVHLSLANCAVPHCLADWSELLTETCMPLLAFLSEKVPINLLWLLSWTFNKSRGHSFVSSFVLFIFLCV